MLDKHPPSAHSLPTHHLHQISVETIDCMHFHRDLVQVVSGQGSGNGQVESLYMWCIVFTYNYSPYWKWKCYFYFWQYLKFWLVLLSILCHVQSSMVCYCLYNVWFVVSWLFIHDVEAWLIQILIVEAKHYIWALILLKVEIVVICQFLLKISVSHINFHIKSPYIVKLPQCK